MEHVPTDRIIDGLDRTSRLLLGDGKGRRDHLFIYQSNKLAAIIKEQYKLRLPPPGTNLVGAHFYDLFRDPREESPVSTPVGAWAESPFE